MTTDAELTALLLECRLLALYLPSRACKEKDLEITTRHIPGFCGLVLSAYFDPKLLSGKTDCAALVIQPGATMLKAFAIKGPYRERKLPDCRPLAHNPFPSVPKRSFSGLRGDSNRHPSSQRSPAAHRYRIRWNALTQGTRLGRKSPAACTMISTAKFFVRIHNTPRKRPASEVSTIEYPTAMNSEGCDPRASCVAAVRK